MQVIKKTNIDIKAFLNAVSKQQLHVGFLEGHKYEEDENGNAPFVAEVAIWNEFGTANTPARPFMQPTFDNQKFRWQKVVNTSILNALKNNNPEGIFNVLGSTVVGDIQKAISQVTEPALAESTIKQKGHSKPLVDSDYMKTSVKYELGEK